MLRGLQSKLADERSKLCCTCQASLHTPLYANHILCFTQHACKVSPRQNGGRHPVQWLACLADAGAVLELFPRRLVASAIALPLSLGPLRLQALQSTRVDLVRKSASTNGIQPPTDAARWRRMHDLELSYFLTSQAAQQMSAATQALQVRFLV